MYLIVRVFAVTVLLVYQADAEPCSKHGKCEQCECSGDGTIATCTDVEDSIFNCLPDKLKELYIKDSLNFKEIKQRDLDEYKNLQKLSIVSTGLAEIDKRAFNKLDDLESVEIIATSSKFTKFSSATFSGRTKLKNITVENCSSFETLQDGIFKDLPSLDILNLQHNAITCIDGNMLNGSVNVTSINLSYNPKLKELPRYVFFKLGKLQKLIVSYCDLEVLYPEHVQTPYESGSLTYFDGDGNNWQCNEMCEFVTWLQTDSSFDSIATMGWCSDNYYQSKQILSLVPGDVCPHNVSIFFQALIGVLFAGILALTCCFMAAICASKFCNYCCKNTSGSASRNTATITPMNEQRNPSYEETDETQNTQFSNETILQADCDVGDWNINSVEPPLYEVVVGDNANDGNKDKFYNTESDSDIAPPPYEHDATV